MRGVVLGLILVFGLWAGALAASPPGPPARGGRLTVLRLRQSAERRLPRDRLKAVLRVEKEDAKPQKVAAAINGAMAQALSLARKIPGIEAETGSYSIYEERPQAGPAFWRGAQELILAGEDAEALLRLTGRLQAAGLLMSSLDYELSPEAVRRAEGDLTSHALSGLRRRARSIAEQLKMKVLRIRDLRVGNAELGGAPRPVFRAALAAAKAMPAPIAAPGRAMVRVTVKAEILLAPASP